MTGRERAVFLAFGSSQPPGSLSSFSNDGIHLKPPADTVSQMFTITFSEATWAAAIESNVDMFIVTCYSYLPVTVEDEVNFVDLVASPTYDIYIVRK